MKRLVCLFGAALLLLGLAGCGEQKPDGVSDKEGGDYFSNYVMSETKESYGRLWMVSGSAHVEEGICLVELENAWQEPVALDLNLTFRQAAQGFELYYVTAETAERLWSVGDEQDIAEGVESLGTALSNSFEAAPGKSRLELRPGEAGETVELEFELQLKNEGGDALQVKMPGELAEGLDELAAGFDDLGNMDNMDKIDNIENTDNIADIEDNSENNNEEDNDENNEENNKKAEALNGNNAPQAVSVADIPVELAAGESLTLLELAPEERCQISVQAELRHIEGDVALVYVLDKKEELLWSSEPGEESVKAKIVDMGFGMVIELEPGEGRLEWRSETGASFVETLLLEQQK